MPKGANKGRDHAPAQITVVRGDSVPLSVTISMLSPRGRTCRTSARRIDPPPCIDAVANARATCEGSSTCADAGYQTPAAPRSLREAPRSPVAVASTLGAPAPAGIFAWWAGAAAGGSNSAGGSFAGTPMLEAWLRAAEAWARALGPSQIA